MPETKLHARARQALLDGRYEKALEYYSELHRAEPDNLRLHVKVAELREKTGDTQGAIGDYVQIADIYAGRGLVVQSIAINKIILRLAPERTQVRDYLATLSRERNGNQAFGAATPGDKTQAADSGGRRHTKRSLEHAPLLSGLSGDELSAFIDSLQLRHVAAGRHIYRKEEHGDHLYLIGMGRVLLRATDAQGRKRVLTHLDEGDFFGEYAFMSRVPYLDEAIAETDCGVLVIDRATFDGLVKKHPGIQSTVEDFYRQRVLARVLSITPIFEGVPEEARMALANRFHLRTFEKGMTIIKEGDAGDIFYLVRSGTVDLTTSSMEKTGDQIALGTMGEGDFFGEIALLTDKPRTATVTASEKTEVMELTRTDFNEISARFPSVRRIAKAYQKQRVQDTIRILLSRKPAY